MRLTNGASAAWQPPQTLPQRCPPATLFALRRISSLTLVLLLAVAVPAFYGVMRMERGDVWQHQFIAWTTCAMLVSLSILILLLGRHTMQKCLRHVEEQLLTLTREDRLEPITAPAPEELRAVLAALAGYVEQVRTRTDRLRLQKKELDIQMRTADAERRHTEAIIFSISDAVLVIDTFAELVLANSAAERLFNFRLSEWRHRPIERVIHDSSLLAMLQETRRGVERAIRHQIDYTALRDGGTRNYTMTLSRVVDADGAPRGVVAVFHDVTRERELAQMKTDFVSAVSHELRTPLSGIKAYVEMLMDGEARDDATRLEFYRIIDAEAERLQRLISRILDISRIEAGVMEIHRTLVRPNEIIRQVLGGLAPQARENEVALVPELDENLRSASADRDLLYQAVQNLVSNAIKYTRRGGRVVLRSGVDGDPGRYTITVMDNGMGIPAADLPHIFEKFYRSREGASVAKGTGLGLNLVKQIVETVHGGEISVASEHGVGTTVVVRLPLDVPRQLLNGAGCGPGDGSAAERQVGGHATANHPGRGR